MPSQRPATLNPRAPAPVAARAPAPAPAPAVADAALLTARAPMTAAPTVKRSGKAAPGGEADVEAARAGGFHESSFELQSGLQVTESEWPDDVTVPGALGDR